MSSYRYDVVEKLGREESARSFTDAQEAGRAFYNADVSKQPLVIQTQGNGGRIMASTKKIGSLQNPDFYKSVPLDNRHGLDSEFWAGYYSEMEKAVFGELGKVDSLEKLSPKARKELEFLYLNNPIKTVSTWEQKTSPALSRPAYFGKTVDEIFEEKRLAELMESAQRQRKELASGSPVIQTTVQEQEENSVEVVRVRTNIVASIVEPDKSQKEKKISPSAEADTGIETQNALPESYLKSLAIPEMVKRKYLQVGTRFYYVNNPEQLAFEDKGNKLHTKSNGVTVAATLVEIANSRGWTEIKVKGSEEFRRAVWLKANAQGIECGGYVPKETDLAALEKQSRQMRAGVSKDGKAASVDRLSGELIDHGAAPFEFNEENPPNYFVTLKNSDGESKTIWGVDLARALEEGEANRGDQVSLKNLGKKEVTISQPIKNSEGVVVGSKSVKGHRNTWEVQAQAVREKKPEELVSEHPGLSNEAVTLKLAEKVSRRFPNKTDQKRFMAGVVDRVASQVEQGQPLPQVKIREPKRGREKLVQER